jgi:MYXO-CTERM domain-containing protein
MRNPEYRSRSRGWVAVALAMSVCTLLTARASAATYYYVDWTVADVAKGTASGVITLPDGSTVQVGFSALKADGTPGTLLGAQINDMATNYWRPPATWVSAEVQNGPPSTDLLRLAGGDAQTYIVTLSAPIKDPIMAIVSLGAPGTAITYNFDSPFTIESQGTDPWNGPVDGLVALPNNVLQGKEGSGTLRFVGTFARFSWTVPKTENWHGFTFGLRTTTQLEPEDAGVPTSSIDAAVLPDASTADSGVATTTDAGTVSADASIVSADAGIVSADAGIVSASDGGAAPAQGVDASLSSSTDPATGGADGGIAPVDSTDEGCSCSTASTPSPSSVITLLLFGLSWCWQRRKHKPLA